VRAFGARAASTGESAVSAGVALARGAAGIGGWYVASSFVFAISILGGGRTVVDETSMRVHVGASGPAARAGVLDGDRIVSAAGTPIHSWDALRAVVSSHGQEPIVLEIDRAGQPITLTATAEGSPPKLLVGPLVEQQSASVGTAISEGLLEPARIVAATFRIVQKSVGGGERAELSGPVAIVRETSNTTRRGAAASFRLVAALAAYVLPYVAFATVLYELLVRRRRKTVEHA
jgi:regulator of sigma E protease